MPQCERGAARLIKQHSAHVAREMGCEELSPTHVYNLMGALTKMIAMDYLEACYQPSLDATLKVSYEQQAVPNRDAVDKIMGCEAAADRSLTRAHDRLERLQRRRKKRAARLN